MEIITQVFECLDWSVRFALNLAYSPHHEPHPFHEAVEPIRAANYQRQNEDYKYALQFSPFLTEDDISNKNPLMHTNLFYRNDQYNPHMKNVLILLGGVVIAMAIDGYLSEPLPGTQVLYTALVLGAGVWLGILLDRAAHWACGEESALEEIREALNSAGEPYIPREGKVLLAELGAKATQEVDSLPSEEKGEDRDADADSGKPEKSE